MSHLPAPPTIAKPQELSRGGVLADHEIISRCLGSDRPMINPFVRTQMKSRIILGEARRDGEPLREHIISFGLSSYGYDVRLARTFKLFTNLNTTVIDPKKMDPSAFVDIETDELIIPPNSFALGTSIERIDVPRDIIVVCLGKSTYARCGIVVNVTPLEPEWRGQITMEISNTAPLPAKIYAGEGIAQLLFLRASRECMTSYSDRQGKYQDQVGVVVAKP